MTQASDLADVADLATQTLVDARITTARNASKKLDTSNPSGICWASDCDTETGPNKRWCCTECRDIWDHDNSSRRR